jgi:Fic family protein
MFEPTYKISPPLLATIKEIGLLVYQLNMQVVPRPTLAQLISEAEVTAVYASTTIEGNPLSLTDTRRLIKNQPVNVRDSELEIINFNTALTDLHSDPDADLTEALILQIHGQVMDGLLPEFQIGRYRQHPIAVHDPRTRQPVFLPPDYDNVPTLMRELIDFTTHERQRLDPILLAGLFHKQFMLIHPFMDGNGRTGRLATKLLLSQLGLNFFPLLSFENYYNRNVTRYFQFVGGQGNFYDLQVDFTAWLEYFAGGILDELIQLQQQVSQQAASPNTRLQPYHKEILTYIDQHGFVTDRDYAKLTDRAKATRALDFKKLIELGLIERVGRGPSTYYRKL